MNKRVAKKPSSEIRIIAGQWRGSKITVSDRPGMRPTPDRVRETLFNWLQQDVPGATVLDCCAGAGGLGLEAASRGAAQVTLVELDRAVAQSLSASADRLKAQQVKVVCADIVDYLHTQAQPYDLVFIDPPYARAQLRIDIMDTLISQKLLNKGARLYLEWPKHEQTPLIPAEFNWIKQKNAGGLSYAIAQWHSTG